MKRLFLCYILLILAFTLSSCDLDLKQYCFHMYSDTYEYNDDEHYLTCNLCKNKEIEKHIFDDGDIIDEPTEESEGVIRFSCEICDYYYDEQIPKNVHKHTYESKWSNDDLYHWLDASCGHDVIDKKGLHSGGTPTCKEQAICEVCKVSYGDLLDHKFENYVYNNDATLDKDGTETAECIYGCGETDTRTKEGSKLNHVHVFDVENVSTDTYASGATCQTPEKYFYSCICGEIGEDTFEYGEPVDHLFVTYIYNNDATIEADGTETAKCEYGCGETHTRTKEGSKLNHVHVFDVENVSTDTYASGATCQTPEKYFYSCICGEIGEDTFEYGEPVDHLFVTYIYNNDATEEHDGTETAYCDYGCGETDTRTKEGSKLNHVHVFNVKNTWIINSISGATCQQKARYYYMCECGEVGTEIFEDGELADHIFSDYVYNNDATETEDGTETAKCEYGCGETDTKVVIGSALGHTHVFNVKNTWIINSISGATCQQKARYYYMCECGEVGTEIFEDGELADHIFSNYVYNNDATETEDGTKTAKCEYGCGETDTKVVIGSALGHTHVFNVKNTWIINSISGATCQQKARYYYMCECGEVGTEIFEDGELADHNYNTPNYFWVNDNLSVTSIAMCSVCNTPLTETVGTTYSVVVEPTEKENGVGRYTTLPFINNNVFNQQFKDVVIKAVVSVLSGNSTYGYNDLLNLENGENMQDFYEKLYSISSEFMSSSENMIVDANGLYTLDTIDVSEFGLTLDEALAVWKIFYLENPSFYWLSNNVSWLGNSLILAIDEAYASASYRAECDEDIMTMISDCETYLSSATTDSEKAKLIHDFIINRIDYAYESDGITPEDDIWAHNIMGAASHEFGVCETYAKTYLFLALLNDVESIIVSGMANGGAHAWNYICIDEKWYGVDATWDDQSYGIIYNYFGTSKSGIADHTPDSNTVMNFDYLYALPELSETGLSVL